MSHTFKLHGDYTCVPASGSPSAAPSVTAPISEQVTLVRAPTVLEYELDADPIVAVSFGQLANASVVVIKAVGGKVMATLTSADGAAQTIPVDSLAVLISESVPYTALSLTRVASTLTTVKVLLGEKA